MFSLEKSKRLIHTNNDVKKRDNFTQIFEQKGEDER